jgi:GNAT superfamily N-acetyltransferase
LVDAPHRGRGVGATLMAAVEAWGGAELGADTELGNQASQAAPRALGLTEVDRIVCVRRL